MNVFKFYNEAGWSKSKKDTNDAILFEDLRPSAKKYVSHSRNRINKYISNKGIRGTETVRERALYKSKE